jgi:CRP-like cAMP-binding protein
MKKESEALTSRLVEKRIKRRQFILQEGDTCKYFTYVVEGCFKMYGVDHSGTEYNLTFAAEDDWVADIDSLHNEKPSRLFIEAMEPSVILQISKGDLWYLYTNFLSSTVISVLLLRINILSFKTDYFSLSAQQPTNVMRIS